MVGIPTDSIRLGMRSPIEFVVRHLLQHFPRVGHLLIKLRQDRFSVSHDFTTLLALVKMVLVKRPRGWPSYNRLGEMQHETTNPFFQLPFLSVIIV
jgi:hypothetical protein